MEKLYSGYERPDLDLTDKESRKQDPRRMAGENAGSNAGYGANFES